MNQEKYIGMDVHAAKAATILEFIQGLRGTLALTFEEGTLGCLVARSAEAPRQPAGGLRSAQERGLDLEKTSRLRSRQNFFLDIPFDRTH
jgi:hypothetical protein